MRRQGFARDALSIHYNPLKLRKFRINNWAFWRDTESQEETKTRLCCIQLHLNAQWRKHGKSKALASASEFEKLMLKKKDKCSTELRPVGSRQWSKSKQSDRKKTLKWSEQTKTYLGTKHICGPYQNAYDKMNTKLSRIRNKLKEVYLFIPSNNNTMSTA